MAQSNTPRRPAMLDAARAETIIGDEDPASLAAVAHTAAWALMGIGDDSFTDEDVARSGEAAVSEVSSAMFSPCGVRGARWASR